MDRPTREPHPGFPATAWTVIQGAQGDVDQDTRRALERLVALYWRPVYATLRHDWNASPEEAQDRLVALQQLQRELTLGYHSSRIGTRTRILVEGPSRKGGEQLRGRDPYHRVVNVTADAGPGDLLEVEIVEATPHSLIGAPSGSTGQPGTRMGLKRDAPIAEEKRRSGFAAGVDPLRVL